jgi:hypothetical protein
MTYVQKNAALGRGYSMIDSYKNVERLRYRIYKDLVSLSKDIRRDNEEQSIVFRDECFCALASAIAALSFSNATFDSLNDFIGCIFKGLFKKNAPEFLTSIITASIGIVMVLGIAIPLNKFLVWKKIKKRNRHPEGKDTTDYIKEFDNIACDSVIVALEYKELYYGTKDGKERTLYYLETLHYLDSGTVILDKLCSDSANIRKPEDNELGVDIFRIHNMKDVMTELYDFLEHERRGNNLVLSDDDKNGIRKNMEKICKRLDAI